MIKDNGIRFAMRICEAYADENSYHLDDALKAQAARDIMHRLEHGVCHFDGLKCPICTNIWDCPVGMKII
jgi:hypothetical protein